MKNSCEHFDQIPDPIPARQSKGCGECEKTGSPWVSLRMCLSCGSVGCCDSSVNHHATEHFKKTGHPVMKSAEPDESWQWCYVDELMKSEEDAA
jgi:CPA1 family monovalent cation:H+ antiporter